MPSESKNPNYYVGIGASAGGLEAIEQFFKAMPIDSGAAFIIIQHLSSDYTSLMPELLSKRTEMQVYRAEDGMEVEANKVYLIVPSKNLTIERGKLKLHTQEALSGRPNLPIDIFFRSLAIDQGEKAIAVELSGTGSDGARGVRAIKEADGMVMVQDAESARFDGMPRSVMALGLADFILPPDEMAKQLVAFIRHPEADPNGRDQQSLLSSDEEALNRIYALLRKTTKLDFTYYKPTTVYRRIERRMTINQIRDLKDYVTYLESNIGEVEILHRELLIGVTNFFRDSEAFKLISEIYLPEILKRAENSEVRLWVAGCSTGEEAYTMAILCQEVMKKLKINREIKIFATDVDRDAIEKAGAGRFAQGIANEVPPNLLSTYFVHYEDCYQITRSTREMVVFAQHNLVKDPPFTNVDFISCRNVLIYLQPVLQRKAMELFNFALKGKGVLMLGCSETTGDMSDYFETLNNKWRIYESKGKRKATGIAVDAMQFDHSRFSEHRLGAVKSAARAHHEEEKILDRFLQGFAEDYVNFAMVLNSNEQVVHAIGDTKSFLHMSPGIITSEASKLISKELAIPLSTGVQKVIKKQETLTFTKIRMTMKDRKVMLQMKIKPLPHKKGQEPLVAIFIHEMVAKNDIDSLHPESVTFDVSKEAEDRISDLEQELQFTRENLQATVEELETSNEELQATNEELLASNEELQSTNEELQSVNEELYTVNAEYQSKITELTELNNDFDNLMSSTGIGTLFLDEDLDIRRFSRTMSSLINIIDGDIGRPISHISHNLKNIDLCKIAKSVMDKRKNVESEFVANNGEYLMLRAVPYQIAPNVYAGVVILFININERKLSQLKLEHLEKHYTRAQQTAQVWSWEWQGGQFFHTESSWPILGYNQPSVLKRYEDYLSLVYEMDVERVNNVVKPSLQNCEAYCIEYRVKSHDGNIRWVSETVEPIKKSSRRMIGIVQDITLRKLAELELRYTQSSAPCVLVVDDDPVIVSLLETYIKQYSSDINVIYANNGFEGLIKAGRFLPELIITDLLMPGMDGFQMIRAMRFDPLVKDVPLVVVTLLDCSEIEKQGGLPLDIKVLEKPFSQEHGKYLHELLAEVIPNGAASE